MTKERLADAIAVFGIAAVVAAGWWIHPAIGLGTGGAVAILVAIGMRRGA